MDAATLARTMEEVGLTVDPGAVERLEAFCAALGRYGRSQRLTGSLEAAEILSHVREALGAVYVALRAGAGGTWVDVGAGGGFPGLVAAAVWEGPVVLVEPRARRAGALEAIAAAAAVDVRVVRDRLEASGWRDGKWVRDVAGVGVASSRAVFPPEVWLARSEVVPLGGAVRTVHVGVGWGLPGGWREVARWSQGGRTVLAVRRVGVRRGR